MTRMLPFWAVVAVVTAGASVQAGSITGKVAVDGSPAMNAVVYLAAPHPLAVSTNSEHAVMDQKDLTFLPAVLPVVRGTVVDFTNSDEVQHNVFSPSAIAQKFNLGTYGPGALRRVSFTELGDVVVLCNIHMEMEAHILVLEAPYFATVRNDGSYEIRDVPSGAYTLKIWQRDWLSFNRTVDVPATGNVDVNVAAKR